MFQRSRRSVPFRTLYAYCRSCKSGNIQKGSSRWSYTGTFWRQTTSCCCSNESRQHHHCDDGEISTTTLFLSLNSFSITLLEHPRDRWILLQDANAKTVYVKSSMFVRPLSFHVPWTGRVTLVTSHKNAPAMCSTGQWRQSISSSTLRPFWILSEYSNQARFTLFPDVVRSITFVGNHWRVYSLYWLGIEGGWSIVSGRQGIKQRCVAWSVDLILLSRD